jgi:competence protein ComEA
VISPSDRRAALFLLLLGSAGLVVRMAVGGDRPAGALLYEPVAESNRPTRDSLAARAARLARPLQAGERIDLNTATAEELARLPRIGPGLAARIVADRAAHGPFASADALVRVPGIGPTTLKGVRAHVLASGVRPNGVQSRVGDSTVTLNTATVEELAQLPGIGPRRAQAIVQERRLRGPFNRIDDLIRVRGIGPAIVEQLRGRVRP